MEDPLYREIILDHAQNPRNHYVLPAADVMHEAVNPLCGDKLTVMARRHNGRFTAVTFVGEACAIATAAASLFTIYATDQPVDAILNLDDEALLKHLGLEYVTPARRGCALLACTALRSSVSSARGVAKQVK